MIPNPVILRGKTNWWKLIHEAFKTELLEIEKIPGISYDLKNNTIRFVDGKKSYSPTDLAEIAAKVLKLRNRIADFVDGFRTT